MIERRRAERIPITGPAGPVSVVGARIVDISLFGMKIQSRVAISPDAILPFRIVVDGNAGDVRCRVATRRSTLEDDRHYAVGLEFLDLPAKAGERLRDVVQRQTT